MVLSGLIQDPSALFQEIANSDSDEVNISIDFDHNADTGAITGSNAGGSTVKNAADIVPEDDVDLSTLPLPEPGSTTPITYRNSAVKAPCFSCGG